MARRKSCAAWGGRGTMKLIKVGELPGTTFYRLEGELPVRPGTGHFHVRAHGVHACLTGIDGGTEAEVNALGEFLVKFESDHGDWSLEEIFGNESCTYCATPDCGGCDLEVHVMRMQDGRLAARPRVLIFDL
jgi:hypothetical protein